MKATEAALRESEERIAAIVGLAMDAIISCDADEKIVLFNAAAEKMFRCAASDVIGTPINRFIPERFHSAHSGHIRRFGEAGVTSRSMGHLTTISGLRDDGEEFPIEASISQIDAGGRKIFTVILRDITKRKQAEEALRLAKEEAEQANRAKDRFLSILSHELRTPLNPVMLAIQAWESDKRLPGEFRADLKTMRHNIEVEVSLIDRLLQITAIRNRKLKLDFEIVEIHELLRYAVEIAHSHERKPEVRVLMAFDAKNSTVRTDYSHLAQVFWNLVNNALKFTPAGGTVTIKTSNEGENIRIDVVDTGIGISRQAQSQIFDAFEQGTVEITQHYGGLGLGLTIAKGVIELLGGKILVASEGEGKGATFSVFLKAAGAS